MPQRARVQALDAMSQAMDWNIVLALARRHGLLPLFERHLSQLEEASVPHPVRAEIWVHAESVRRRNLAMSSELARIVGTLQEAGIESIAYKGPTLALQAYGDPSLREFGDLDLLVRRDRALDAKDVLGGLGYTMQKPLGQAQQAALIASPRLYELPLIDGAQQRLVELHWRTDPDVDVLALDQVEWWQELPRMVIEGRDVRVLPPEELLVTLCLHGTKHFWSSLGWLVDIAELIRSQADLDWHLVTQLAERHRCRRRVQLGLLLARDILDAPVDARQLPTVHHDAIASTIVEAWFDQSPRTPTLSTALLLNLRLHDDARRRVAYVWNASVAPGWGEWARWRLPGFLSFLYFPLRAARLTAKYCLPMLNRPIPRTPAAATPRTPPPRPHSTG